MTETSRPQGATKAAAGNGRDSQGRFVKGNGGGPGNPFARRTAALRQALCAAVSEEDVRAIAEAMKEKAKAGDVAAAKLVLGYVVGRPAEVVNPDTLDEAEMEQYLQQPALAAGLPGVLGAIAPELCCTVVRAARPDIVKTMAREMGQAMFTGHVPGTGEQICPPLERAEGMGQPMPESATPPLPKGENGTAETAIEGSRRRSGPRARRKAVKGVNGAGGSQRHGRSNGQAAQREQGGKQEARKTQGERARRQRPARQCSGASGNGKGSARTPRRGSS